MSKSMTPVRVNGTNQYCQNVCSPLFTACFTTPKKDRLTVLSVLTDFMPPQHLYNRQAQILLETFKLADKTRVAIDAQLPFDVVMNENEFKAYLPLITLGTRQSIILPKPVPLLITNNKPPFQSLQDCWLMMRHTSNCLPDFSVCAGFMMRKDAGACA